MQWILMLLLAAVLLYFAFRGVKWEDFISGVKSCDFRWIVVSMLASVAAFEIRGMRWRLVMLPLNPTITVREAYDGVTVAYLTNFALPRAGELARCGVISATGKASFESVLGTVVLERSWDMLTYIVILLAVLIMGESSFRQFVSDQVWKPAVDSMSFNFLWVVVMVSVLAVAACVLMYVYRERLRRYRFFDKLFGIVSGLAGGLAAGLRMKHKWRFLLYTLLLWSCYWLMSYTTILAFPQVSGLNWADALFLMVVGSLGWIVPVQGGIGAYHFILSLAMASIYSIPQTSGVIFATISHESQALTMLLCGAVSVFSIYLKKRKNRKTQ
ncbi:MAG TPA: flippase-like domain-containing protein [Candidatus Coprenecus stercoravium]|uniref:Flippase-like domain-containing protein n=1 Tax=Candidatus Coprenecus stercoravium TaxID=2840735 RepID=A0A9D2GQB0_9BACT|nr:flippase-like domain-containing protein [Candidatus Coprenecus stercoravium]